MMDHWVVSWAAIPQSTEPDNLPPTPFVEAGVVMAGATLRQTVRVSLGGDRLRLRFSNVFGAAVLPIASVAVARPAGGLAGVAAVEPGTSMPVTFAGSAAVTVAAGAQVFTDPVEFPVAPGENLTVTIFLASGQGSTTITSHPGSRTTSYLASGDHVSESELPAAAPVEHWYFLSGLDVLAPAGAASVVVLGDSLSDGRGSTTNGNDRWPDLLFDRLQSGSGTAQVGVVNAAAGGNRVLRDEVGPAAVARFDRDVLAQAGVRWLIVFEGVNDIGTADADPAAQQAVVGELTGAFERFVERAHGMGIAVFGATLTPFGGNDPYDDPAGVRQASRQALNDWIRTSGRFDAVLDFDSAVRDPADPTRLLPAFDCGDRLHLTPAGYGALAAAVPLRLFAER